MCEETIINILGDSNFQEFKPTLFEYIVAQLSVDMNNRKGLCCIFEIVLIIKDGPSKC